jgi:tRNA threonylcarbamoyladenosine biosynthesis protein TsaE
VRQSAATTLNLATADETRDVGRALGTALLDAGQGPCVVAIEGDLGAGKTTLVSGVLRSLGIDGAVRSPTYTLIEPYESRDRQIFHLDLYRLATAAEVEGLGLRDLLTPTALLLVEWPSRGAGQLPPPDLDLRLEYPPSGDGRRLTLEARSPLGDRALQRFVAAKPE